MRRTTDDDRFAIPLASSHVPFRSVPPYETRRSRGRFVLLSAGRLDRRRTGPRRKSTGERPPVRPESGATLEPSSQRRTRTSVRGERTRRSPDLQYVAWAARPAIHRDGTPLDSYWIRDVCSPLVHPPNRRSVSSVGTVTGRRRELTPRTGRARTERPSNTTQRPVTRSSPRTRFNSPVPMRWTRPRPPCPVEATTESTRHGTRSTSSRR